jgi:hypothetical protein
MPSLIISDAENASSLILDDYLPAGEFPAVTGELFYRLESEPDAEPIKFCDVVAGKAIRFPFEPKEARAFRFYLVSHDKSGAAAIRNIKDAVQTVFSPASEQKSVVAGSVIDTRLTIVDSASPTTQTLPDAGSFKAAAFTIKNIGAGAVTLSTSAGQTIDGASTKTLAQYDSITVESDSAAWIII